MNDQSLAPYGVFGLRVSLGVMTLAHGLMKVFVFTIPGTVGFFESLGLPAAIAYLTIAAEILGGLTLIGGALTRVAALALVPVLLGATWAHSGNGWVFSNAGGGWEYPLFWTVALLVQSLVGPGAWALDNVIAARKPAVATA
jgi:putative oxidoreductase